MVIGLSVSETEAGGAPAPVAVPDDERPVLLLLDVQDGSMVAENEYLLPSLAFVQDFYSDVVLSCRSGGGPPSVPGRTGAMVRGRRRLSAAGHLRSLPSIDRRVIHVCAPDVGSSLLSTLCELHDAGLYFLVLEDLCGSRLGRVHLRSFMSIVQHCFGAGRVVPAADCVIVPDKLLVADDPLASQALLRAAMRRILSPGYSSGGSFEAAERAYLALALCGADFTARLTALSAIRRPDAGGSAHSGEYFDPVLQDLLRRLSPGYPSAGAFSPDIVSRFFRERGLGSGDTVNIVSDIVSSAENSSADALVAQTEESGGNGEDCGTDPDDVGLVAGDDDLLESLCGSDPGVGASRPGHPAGAVGQPDSGDECADVESGWCCLCDYSSSALPLNIRFPGDAVVSVSSWVDVLYAVVDWLIDAGLIASEAGPVYVGSSWYPILLFEKPADDVGTGWRQRPGGHYVRSRDGRADILRRSAAILRQFGADVNSVELLAPAPVAPVDDGEPLDS